MPEQPLQLGYKPRWYQAEFENAMFTGKRRAYLLYHRKAGKDIACWAFMINCALWDQPAAYYYVFPTYQQGRKVLWDGIDQDGRKLLDYIPEQLITNCNQAAMKIELCNGSLIQVMGAEDPDSLRGPNVYGVVFSEWAVCNPRAWTEVIFPMIDSSGGWAIFNTTPLGKNHAWDLWVTANTLTDKWYTKKLTIEETGLVPISTIEERRAEGISEEVIQQEYYCSFERGVEGSYYGRIMARVRAEGRIGKMPWEPRSSVQTYWDIGYGDSTAIVFSQEVGAEHRIIDYYEASGEGLSHYIKVLQSKPYIYGRHFMPHDAGSGSVQTGYSLEKVARELGMRDVVVLKRYGLEEGIEACRAMLHTAFIDENNCKVLIKCLEGYHRKFNERMNCYSDTPEHDWTSHACFTGDTKILTRNGTCRIMDLSEQGEVMTLCGWKKYQNVRITRRNVQLVEIRFVGGYTVKCTPDHLFATDKGWISARHLTNCSEILSSWTSSHNISMEDSIGYGQKKITTLEEELDSIEQYGKTHLEIYLKVVISITKMVTQRIIDWITSSAWMLLNILRTNGKSIKKALAVLLKKLEIKQQNGTDQTLAVCGINGTQSDRKAGPSGKEKKRDVCFVKKNSCALSEKMDTHTNFVPITARRLNIESVHELSEREDVWCMEVPEAGHFSLENGAIVHNCDAMRYCALARACYGRGEAGQLTKEKINDMRFKNLGY